MLEVIGAGFGRNGTDSLRHALEILGFSPCHHMSAVIDSPEHLAAWQTLAATNQTDWDTLLNGYCAQVDWPGAAYWRQLADHFPTAKVILSVRDPDAWFESIQNTILPFIETMKAQDENAHLRDLAQWSDELIVRGIFDGKLNDRAHAVRVYKEHIAAVTHAIAPERLLVYEVGSGWDPLCKFLRCPLPDVAYPNTNSSAEFQENNQI